jgi:hypothetical protein
VHVVALGDLGQPAAPPTDPPPSKTTGAAPSAGAKPHSGIFDAVGALAVALVLAVVLVWGSGKLASRRG